MRAEEVGEVERLQSWAGQVLRPLLRNDLGAMLLTSSGAGGECMGGGGECVKYQ